MSGRKQHYIPQVLLRGFGNARRGKTYVTVFKRGAPTFEVPTEGIAAEREFYSKVSNGRELPSLDDKITLYENDIATKLRTFREMRLGDAIDGAIAGEIVAHLTIRNAHMRASSSEMAVRLVDEIIDVFTDEARTRRAMGIGPTEFNGPALERIEELWSENQSAFTNMGLTRESFSRVAFEIVSPQFEDNFKAFASVVSAEFGRLAPRLATIGAEAQLAALERGMAPAKSVEVLSKLLWRVRGAPEEGLILPDCVAVSVGVNWSRPLSISSLPTDGCVVFPISTRRMLVANSEGNAIDISNINRILAECSSEYFVANRRSEIFENLKSLISVAKNEAIGELLNSVREKYP